MKVDFFIIGPPRCASTSLASYLGSHPDVCFAIPKEPTYFCTDIPAGYENMPTSVKEYHQAYFGHYDPSQHKVVGEGTPLYLMSKCAIPNILSYNPAAKLIALARNPIEIAASMHSARVRVGLRHETISDFEEAWDAQEDRRQGLRLPNIPIRKAVLQYRELAAIGTQYERLMAQVAPDNLHVIVNDDLKANPGQVRTRLLDFLGLDPFSQGSVPHKEFNSQWSSESARRIHHLLGTFAGKLPFRLRLGLLESLKNRLVSRAPRKELRPEFRQRLREEFANEISKLSNLLDRDFSHWK